MAHTHYEFEKAQFDMKEDGEVVCITAINGESIVIPTDDIVNFIGSILRDKFIQDLKELDLSNIEDFVSLLHALKVVNNVNK